MKTQNEKMALLNKECDRILERWFLDAKICKVNIRTKLNIIQLLPRYALNSDISEPNEISLVDWISNFIDMDEKTKADLRRGFIRLDSIV